MVEPIYKQSYRPRNGKECYDTQCGQETMLLLLLLSCLSCPTPCDPIDDSSPGSPVPGILQARTLEWLAISSIASGLQSPVLSPHPTELAARLTAEEITFSSVCALNLDFKETLLLPMSLVAQPWFLG